jgi:hypothetical protein
MSVTDIEILKEKAGLKFNFSIIYLKWKQYHSIELDRHCILKLFKKKIHFWNWKNVINQSWLNFLYWTDTSLWTNQNRKHQNYWLPTNEWSITVFTACSKLEYSNRIWFLARPLAGIQLHWQMTSKISIAYITINFNGKWLILILVHQ